MREVVFPGLNLKVLFSNILFSIGNINIYWYSVLIVFSIIIALIGMKKENGKYGINYDDILQLLIFLIPISFICARIYYVIFKLGYYIKEPIQILNIRNGGLAIYGGIIGGILFILVYCKIKKINILNMLDFISPYLAIGQSIGRWGNFLNVEAYGSKTNNIFRMGIIENGKYIEVHPTFLYESIATLLIFLILMFFRNKRKYKGQLTLIYFTSYCFIRTSIEELRKDSLMIGVFRISQIVSIIIFVICFSVLFYKNIIERNKKYAKTRV